MGMGCCDGGCEGLDCWEEEEDGFHIGLFNLRRRKTGSVSVSVLSGSYDVVALKVRSIS
jgi:hypothetical protein